MKPVKHLGITMESIISVHLKKNTFWHLALVFQVLIYFHQQFEMDGTYFEIPEVGKM
jgi:hypothetical protein